ncbi:MAG: hypothetical protein FJX42_01535 [Alphaproteobacteria bacterium]|nr:hypothetical protein [Alphaproteobacteria bacterium]
MRRFSSLFPVAAVLLLAACRAPEDPGKIRWQNPAAGEEQQMRDERECRRQAEAETERAARRARIFDDDGLMRPGSYDAMMSRHEAVRQTNRLMADCLRRRGYAPASEK